MTHMIVGVASAWLGASFAFKMLAEGSNLQFTGKRCWQKGLNLSHPQRCSPDGRILKLHSGYDLIPSLLEDCLGRWRKDVGVGFVRRVHQAHGVLKAHMVFCFWMLAKTGGRSKAKDLSTLLGRFNQSQSEIPRPVTPLERRCSVKV